MKNIIILIFSCLSVYLNGQVLRNGYSTMKDSFAVTITAQTTMPNMDGAEALWFADTLWNICGWLGTSQEIDTIRYSLDEGATWTYATRFPGGVRHATGFVKQGDTYFIIGKTSDLPHKSDVWKMGTSPRSWTQMQDTSAWPIAYFRQAVSLRGELYVLGGQDTITTASAVKRDVWKSSDEGVTWIEVCSACAPNIGNVVGCVTVWRNRIWVIGGEKYGTVADRRKTVFSSADGLTWVQHEDLPSPTSGGLSYPKIFVWDGKLWVYGGYNSNTQNTSKLLWTTSGLTSASWRNADYVGMRETHAAAVAWQRSSAFYVTSGNWQSGGGDINKEVQKVVKTN